MTEQYSPIFQCCGFLQQYFVVLRFLFSTVINLNSHFTGKRGIVIKLTEEKLARLKQLKDKIANDLDNTEYKEFIDFIYRNGFFNNASEEDLSWNLGDDCKKYGTSISTLKNNGIAIGMDFFRDKVRVGIDPTKFFNKTRDCSIIVYFPIGKREYKSFIKLLCRLMDRKDSISKLWFKESGGMWCGGFAEFGWYKS